VIPPHSMLTYSLREHCDPNDVLDELGRRYQAHGYRRLQYELDEPSMALKDGWEDEVYTLRGETIRRREREQCWLKLAPAVTRLRVSLSQSREGPVTVTAIVVALASDRMKEILAYAEVHPEAFDPEDVERLRSGVEANASEKR
jgi:hypothetical protein